MEVRESKREMFKLNDFVRRYIQSVTILRKSRQSFRLDMIFSTDMSAALEKELCLPSSSN